MAMQGVPWTKVWGAMFLFAFLVIEAGALLGKKSSMSSAYSSLPAINGQATRTTSERQVLQGFETIETFTFWYGIMAHCAVFVWAFFDLWILRASAYDSVEKGIMASLVSLIFIVYLGNILICCAPLTVLALFFEFATYLRDHPPRNRVRKWLNRACIGGLVICAFGVISLGIYGIAEHRELVVDCVFFDLSLVSIPAFVFIIMKLCILSPRLRDTVLVASREESSSAVNEESLPSVDEGSPVVDEAAVWSLTFCIANIVLCLLWYWLSYKSDGTVNPSWTGVFG
jgi:hypothetical protein